MHRGESLSLLLQLVSPTLPVGGYSYSRGLENAVEERIVQDEHSAARWLKDHLHYTIYKFEAPLYWRMYQGWKGASVEEVMRWNDFFYASCETAELRAEAIQMGSSLAALLRNLGSFTIESLSQLNALDSASFPAVFGFAACEWRISPRYALQGYMFSLLEHQVSAAIKIVPLGQTTGQRILYQLAAEVATLAAAAVRLNDEDISNFAIGAAIASSRHETQYSRLFRS